MSDVMLFGVLKMPYEMAMASELSRFQFYQRVQELVARVEVQPPLPVQEPPIDFELAYGVIYADQQAALAKAFAAPVQQEQSNKSLWMD